MVGVGKEMLHFNFRNINVNKKKTKQKTHTHKKIGWANDGVEAVSSAPP